MNMELCSGTQAWTVTLGAEEEWERMAEIKSWVETAVLLENK